MEEKIKKWERDFFTNLQKNTSGWVTKAMGDLRASTFTFIYNINDDSGVILDPVFDNESEELNGVRLWKVFHGNTVLYSSDTSINMSNRDKLKKVLDEFTRIVQQ